MPEPQTTGTRQIVALMMIISALSLVVLAALIFARIVPLPDETRQLAVLVIGAAAFADLLIGIWFFRKGQSS